MATRTAFVSGASRGLGLALARALAHQGWTLLLTARGAPALAAAEQELAHHTQVVALPGDIADPLHRRALAAAAARLAPVHALVNNAGSLGPSPLPPLLLLPPEALEALLRVNVVAQLGVIQALAPHLAKEARIVNVSSDAAVEGYPGWGAYGSSKAALEQLSRVLAAEQTAWRVYWVDPGDMRTQMHQDAFPGEDISDRPLPESSVPGLLALLTRTLPSGRYQARALAAQPVAG